MFFYVAEIEEGPDTNNQPSSSVDPLPASEESTHNGRYLLQIILLSTVFILFINSIDGQRDVLADRAEAAASQIPTYCWYWFWSMLVLLGLIIVVYFSWHVLILMRMGIVIGILGYPVLISNNHQGIRCRTPQSCHSGLYSEFFFDISCVYFR